MNKSTLIFIASGFFILWVAPPVFAQSAVKQALESYRGLENLDFSAVRGEALWRQSNISKSDGKNRQCTTCHGKILTQFGKHAKTGKQIDPMAPSVAPERYTELKKIEKWFKRNCNWTFGRACTAQEKGDLLKYLSQL